MRLNRMKVRSFKGIKQFELVLNGRDAAVFGENAAGKTTLADAWSWILFGKDSSGAASFELKPLDEHGKAIHGLGHEVEAEIEMPDGRTQTFRKCYKEQWTKRRGSADKEFTGHTTEMHIDGVPHKAGEYSKAIAELADERTFQLLSDPVHFSERMPWKERRQLLLEVCGDVSDTDVIASDPALADLSEILNGRKVAQHRKVISERKKDVNRDIERIPVRIDEVTRSRPAEPEEGAKGANSLTKALEKLRELRSEAQQRKADAAGGGGVAKLRAAARGLRSEIEEAEATAGAEARAMKRQAQRTVDEARENLEDSQRLLKRAESEIQRGEQEVERLGERTEQRREAWKAKDAEKFQDSTPGTCAACGQELPEEEVAAAREKALAQFNAAKAHALREIDEEGKALKQLHEAAERDLAAAKEEAERLAEQCDELKAQLTEEKEQAELVTAEKAEENPALDAMRTQLEELIAKGKSASEANKAAEEAAAAEIKAIDEEIAESERELALFRQRIEADTRIEELVAEERQLAAEYEDLERQLWLCEEFTRRKVSMLEEKINDRFRIARFKLFNVLVNGGLEECCETRVGGVPWPSLNHGSRIQAGMDIIRTLQEHFGVAPPVIVDQCESVTRLPEMECQIIRLIVSEGDKKLRVEINEKAEQPAA